MSGAIPGLGAGGMMIMVTTMAEGFRVLGERVYCVSGHVTVLAPCEIKSFPQDIVDGGVNYAYGKC